MRKLLIAMSAYMALSCCVIGSGNDKVRSFEKLKFDGRSGSIVREVDSYDEYLQGNPAYYFCIRDEDDKIVDSVTGFRGDKIETWQYYKACCRFCCCT